jgi:hypothetical protein
MEGFVEISKGRRYQRSWAVLDGQQLSYYEKLDVKLQEAVNIQVWHTSSLSTRSELMAGRDLSSKCGHQ